MTKNHLRQWFPNFFECDPNMSLVNTSRPKPATAKKNVFSMSAPYYFSNTYAIEKTQTNSRSVAYYKAMIYYKQIYDSVRFMKLKFLLHNTFNARLYFAECTAHVVTKIEAIAILGFNDRKCRKSLLTQARSGKRKKKSHGFDTNYWFFLFDRSPELSK